jgi:hypothetical protein
MLLGRTTQYEVDLAEPVEAIYAVVPQRDSFQAEQIGGNSCIVVAKGMWFTQ